MINNLTLMGRLTADPEIRYLQNTDTAVARFSLAVERDYKTQGEERPRTDFINCTAWRNTAEFIGKYFRKGNMIAVEGSVETDSYTDRDGRKIYTTYVHVRKGSFTGERSTQGSSQPEETPPPSNGDGFMNIPDGIDSELPFN